MEVTMDDITEMSNEIHELEADVDRLTTKVDDLEYELGQIQEVVANLLQKLGM